MKSSDDLFICSSIQLANVCSIIMTLSEEDMDPAVIEHASC